jgi:O-antigen ligase
MRRTNFIFLVSLFVFVGSVVATSASIAQRNYDLRGYINPTQTSELPFRLPRFGVNADLRQYDEERLRENLDMMQRIGVTWVRQMVYWDEIQPTSTQSEWDPWDSIVPIIAEYQTIELIPVFVHSPPWSRPNTTANNLFSPPTDIHAFGDFVSEFAERYGKTVDYYQIWDEPNIRLAWGNEDPRPAEYVALLASAYDAINDADTKAYVIAAALAPTTEQGPENLSDVDYLSALYALDADQYTDGFAAKPYGFDLPPDDRTISMEQLNFSRIVALRETMVVNGDARKHLWISNWGWNSLPVDWDGNPSIWGQITKQDQIKYTLNGLERADREWPWLGGMILQSWQPDSTADDAQWGFSLLDTDGTPKPLYDSLLLREQSSRDLPSNGLFHASSESIRYSGAWTFGELGADVGWIQDSSLSFDFSGSEVSLLVREDDYVAQLYVSIDGQPASSLPQDQDGNAYLQLKSDTLDPKISLVNVATGLSDSVHTLHLAADELLPDEANNRWHFVGFGVSDGDMSEPYDRQVNLAWLTVVIAAIATISSGRFVNWKQSFAPISRIISRLSIISQFVVGLVSSVVLMIGMLLTWDHSMPLLFKRDSIQIGLSLITAGLLYINEFGIVFAIVAGIVLFILIFHHLETGLFLIIFWAPFFLFPVELYSFAFPIAEIILVITFASWLLRLVYDWTLSTQSTVTQYQAATNTWPPIYIVDVLMMIWVALGALALINSARFGIASTEFRTLFLQPAMFYLILRTIHLDQAGVIRLLIAIVVSAFIVSLVGIYMFFDGTVIEAEAGARRLVSVYGSPNNVGLLLGRVLPFLVAAGIFLRGKLRLAASAVLIVCGIALLLTQSAGAIFIGVPGSIIIVITLSLRRKALIPIASLVAISAIGLMVALQMPRFDRLTDFTQGTNFYRLRVWESGLQMVEDNPIIGIGLDQFLYDYRGEYILPDAWEEPELSHPHNIVLDFWLRLGVLGVAWLITFIVVVMRIAMTLYKRLWTRNDFLLPVLIGIIGGFANIMLHGLVDNSIYVLDQAYIFLLLAGLLVTIANISAIDDTKETMV